MLVDAFHYEFFLLFFFVHLRLKFLCRSLWSSNWAWAIRFSLRIVHDCHSSEDFNEFSRCDRSSEGRLCLKLILKVISFKGLIDNLQWFIVLGGLSIKHRNQWKLIDGKFLEINWVKSHLRIHLSFVSPQFSNNRNETGKIHGDPSIK